LQKGIKYLSHINAVIFFGFVFFLFLFGPTRFLLNSAVEVSGSFITNLIPSFFNLDAFGQDKWSGGWTIFFWAWWIVYAPIIGMFLARIAVGRTIREFVLVNVFVPGAFVFSWFIAFGGSAIYMDHFNQAGIMGVINEKGLEVAMYALFEHLPLANIMVPLGIFALGISFVTLADSMTSTIAIMTTKNTLKAEAPSSVKIFWGVLTGSITIICLLVTGSVGTKALQTASIVAALPIFIIMMGTLVSIIMFASKYKTRIDLPEYYPEELEPEGSGTLETTGKNLSPEVTAQGVSQVAIRAQS
jgi:choline-glycine betaine transporter